MSQHLPQKFIPVLQCLIILLTFSDSSQGDQSRISFKDGLYDISIAFDNRTVDGTNCSALIKSLNETLFEASGYLSELTPQPVGFGTVRILIPRDWMNCELDLGQVEIRDTYEAANIKISGSHPIAVNLPWAEQHRGCGQESNAMFIPPNFLIGESFNGKERGSIFGHEWLKFRYGTFEEYGYFDDEFYLPCYKKNGSIYFTGCTNPVLLPFPNVPSDSLILSPAECRKLINNNLDDLKAQLLKVNSSLLFSPLSSSDQIGGACSNTSHNWFVNTKQNIQCDRRSSSEIIKSHRDFQSARKLGQDKALNIPPTIVLVKHSVNVGQGYAFLIENSPSIQQNNRQTYVKQSIAEFVELIEGQDVYVTSTTFHDNIVETRPEYPMQIAGNWKKDFLAKIPDNQIQFLKPPVNPMGTKSLSKIFDALILHLNFFNDYPQLQGQKVTNVVKWNIIFITSLSPVNIPLERLKLTDYSISVLTFDTAEEWLQWNSILQTRKLINLPTCIDGTDVICNGLTSTLLTNHFLEVLRSQQPNPLVYQKIVELEINGTDTEKLFDIPALMGNDKSLFFFLSRYSDNNNMPTLTSTSGQICTAERLWDYNKVVIFKQTGNCAFYGGQWTLNLPPSSDPSYMLRGYMKTDTFNNPQQDLIVLPSFDFDLAKPIFLSTQNLMVALHVMVKTSTDHPVVSAVVTADIFYDSGNGLVKTVLNLFDNGKSPDTTKDDGVYSTFVEGFSPFQSYHSGSIHVITTNTSFTIQGLSEGNKAILLEPKLDEKCCGSFVPIGSSSSIGYTFYTSTLPSFKTGDAGPYDSPPSRIETIKVDEETDTFIKVSFTAPGKNFNSGAVDSYDICIVNENPLSEDLCQNVSGEKCVPVNPGTLQTCEIDKQPLQSNLEVIGNASVGDEIMIAGRLRGVDNEQHGPLSSYLVEIKLGVRDLSPKCDSISDDCLPIEIFWILIGCLAGVLLILIIVSCCWFWLRRRSKKRERTKNENWEPKRNNYDNRDSRVGSTAGRSSRSTRKQINHLPFDEDDFDRPPSRRRHDSPEMMSNNDRSFPGRMRKRSLSTGEIHTKFQPSTHTQPDPPHIPDMSMNHDTHKSTLHHPQQLNHDRDDQDEMPVFFSNGTIGNSSHFSKNPKPNGYNSSFKKHSRPDYDDKLHPNSFHHGTSSYQPNPRNSELDFNYPSQNSTATFPLPSISSTIDMQMSNESLKLREPVYASVNRSGRRSGHAGHQDRNSALSLPPNVVEFRNNNNNNYLSPKNHHQQGYNGPSKSQLIQSRPQSSQSLDSGFVISQSPVHLPPPPIRMDRFPSSESETYSEMSREPPPPPPMPIPGTGNKRRPHSVGPTVNHDSTGELGDSQNASEERIPEPRPRSKTPPSTNNAFGILARMGPIPDRNTVLKKPRQGPPPPPPPRSTFKKPDQQSNSVNKQSGGNSYELRKTNDSDMDDDSDNWDVYDDFDFNPGVSHV